MGWGSIVVGCCIDAVNRPSLDPLERHDRTCSQSVRANGSCLSTYPLAIWTDVSNQKSCLLPSRVLCTYYCDCSIYIKPHGASGALRIDKFARGSCFTEVMTDQFPLKML